MPTLPDTSAAPPTPCCPDPSACRSVSASCMEQRVAVARQKEQGDHAADAAADPPDGDDPADMLGD